MLKVGKRPDRIFQYHNALKERGGEGKTETEKQRQKDRDRDRGREQKSLPQRQAELGVTGRKLGILVVANIHW